MLSIRGTGHTRRLEKLARATQMFVPKRPMVVISVPPPSGIDASEFPAGWVTIQLRGQAVGLDITVPRNAWDGEVTGPLPDSHFYVEIREWTAQLKQAQFLCRREDEVLFGGAMGGGKTDALIIYMVLRALAYPGSHHLYVRNRLRDLEKAGSFLDRSEAFLTGIGHFRPSKWEWTLPGRSTIECGYCETEDDIGQYRTAQWETIVFDEVSLFTESQFIGISSRARSTVESCESFVRSATNPGGQGHAWVKLRWIDASPANTSFTIVPPVTVSRGRQEGKALDEYSGAAEWARLAELQDSVGKRSAIFIPSKLWDNQILMTRDPKYVQLLDSMPEQQRRMYLYGDWDVFAGQAFAMFRREIHVMEPFAIPPDWKRWIGYDFGLRDPACALWLAESPSGDLYVYDEMYIKNCTAEAQAKIIADISKGQNIIGILADPSVFSREANGTSIYGQMVPYLNRISMVPANNDRMAGWQALRHALDWAKDKPQPRLRILANCINLIRTLPALTFDKKVNRLEDVNTKQDDHAADALRYVLMGASVKAQKARSLSFEVAA